MVDFTHRPLSPCERDVSTWVGFVYSIVDDGYGDSLDEYPNDLSCRDRIESHRDVPEMREMWTRVEEADRKLMAVLQPTRRCFCCGGDGCALFWHLGYPKNSHVLEEELRDRGFLGG